MSPRLSYQAERSDCSGRVKTKAGLISRSRPGSDPPRYRIRIARPSSAAPRTRRTSRFRLSTTGTIGRSFQQRNLPRIRPRGNGSGSTSPAIDGASKAIPAPPENRVCIKAVRVMPENYHPGWDNCGPTLIFSKNRIHTLKAPDRMAALKEPLLKMESLNGSGSFSQSLSYRRIFTPLPPPIFPAQSENPVLQSRSCYRQVL